MNGYIRSRIFIDGMVMKDINQVFDRLDKINLIFGEVLDQDDWEEIFEHTKQASMLIPPMNEQHVYYIYPTHVISSSEGLPTFKHVTEKGHLLDDKFLEEHFTKLD